MLWLRLTSENLRGFKTFKTRGVSNIHSEAEGGREEGGRDGGGWGARLSGLRRRSETT